MTPTSRCGQHRTAQQVCVELYTEDMPLKNIDATVIGKAPKLKPLYRTDAQKFGTSL